MSVTAPTTISTRPKSDRATCGGSCNDCHSCEAVLWLRARDRLGGRRVRVAMARSLDLDHDREHHGPALGALVQVLAERVLDLRLEQRNLADVVTRVQDRAPHAVGR